MIKARSQKGSITIFISIISCVLIIFCGILIDVARIHMYSSAINQDSYQSLKSVMANYDKVLKELYGIFLINNNLPIDNEFKQCLQSNLSSDNLFNYKIEDVHLLTYKKNTFKQQILNYTKLQNIDAQLADFNNKLHLLKEKYIDIKLDSKSNLKLDFEESIFKTPIEFSNLDYNHIKKISTSFETLIDKLPENVEISTETYKFDDVMQLIKNGECDKIFSSVGNLKSQLTISPGNILLNHYIIGTFKNYSSNFETSKDKDFRGILKHKRKTFFKDYEVEYILSGSSDSLYNLNNVKNQIFLLRFIFNSIYIYNNDNMQNIISEYVKKFESQQNDSIKNKILFLWAVAESTIDTDLILKGKDVVLYKTDKTWLLNFDMLKSNNKKFEPSNDNQTILLSYKDYLKILLALQDESLKLKRIKNLIQLNLWEEGNRIFDLNNYNDCIIANVEISIKYIFLTKLLIPKTYKTFNNRHVLKTQVVYTY